MAVFRIKRGLDIPISGKPQKEIIKIENQSVFKIHPVGIKGLKPKLLVKEGDQVKIGTPLLYNKLLEKVKFVAPACGIVKSIIYGPRRVINEISIEQSSGSEEYIEFESYNENQILEISRDEVKKLLLKSGTWTYIRQRPFSKLADPDDVPKSIFISGFNTAPLTPELEFIFKHDNSGFQAGINAFSRLTDGKIHLSVIDKSENLFSSLTNVEFHTFKGPHPAGNIGIQIHHIDPLNLGEKVWYVDFQDVCAIGNLFLTGKFHTTKFITVGGSGVKNPTYIKTRRCVQIGSILHDNIVKNEKTRIISGDILTGKTSSFENGIGYYHQSITVIQEGGNRHFLGWVSLGINHYSASNTFISKLLPEKEYSFNTMMKGDNRAIIPFGYWESVLPMDLIPNYLIRSILAKDIEEMEKLGIYECDEEDFALCSFVCQSKFPVHQIIRDGLELLEAEG